MTTPDVFISYARADEPVARLFAEALGHAGLNVWWDDDLRSGEVFDQAIEAALRAAKAVIVLWSPHSASSRWVRAEATLADRNRTMVPVTIAACERPIIFELMHTADLSGWRGDANDAVWQNFLHDVRKQVRDASSAQATPSAHAAAPVVAAPALDQQSVVVLPFANMSHDPEQEYFADGMTEDIITDLSKVSALMVIARNTAFTFKGKHVDVVEAARQLNVTHVLEGSVRKAGNRVRVTAQLIDGSTGGHVWAERYDRDLDDIFALQDELSQAIVGALRLKLLPGEKKAIEARGTGNLEAYDLYLRAKEGERQFRTQGAIEYARAAVALDPDFSEAWETLAILCIIENVMAPDSQGALERAREAFARAAATAGDRQRAAMLTATRLQLVERNWLAADQALNEVRNESFASSIIAVPEFNVGPGSLSAAVDRFRNLLRSDPLLSLPIHSFVLDCLRRHAEADIEADRMRRAGAALYLVEYFTLLRMMVRGDGTGAIAAQFEKFLALDSGYIPIHRQVIASLDDKRAIAALVRKAMDEGAYQDGPRMNGLAQLAGYAGDHELTLTCLRRSFIDFANVTLVGLWHPLFAGARQREGFKQIIRELEIDQFWRKSGKWGDFARPAGEDDFEIIA